MICLNEGIFLTNRVEGIFGYNLYAYSGFYIVARLNNKKNEIDEIKTFISLNPLEPYLETTISERHS